MPVEKRLVGYPSEYEVFICTKDDPWTDDNPIRHVKHSKTEFVSDTDYTETRRCVICGKVFTVELPE